MTNRHWSLDSNKETVLYLPGYAQTNERDSTAVGKLFHRPLFVFSSSSGVDCGGAIKLKYFLQHDCNGPMSTGRRSPGLPLDWARGSHSDSVPSLSSDSSHIGERKLRTVEDRGILWYSKPPKVFFVSASEASRFG